MKNTAREGEKGREEGKTTSTAKKKRKLKKGSQFVCYFVSFFDPHRQIWLKHKPWDIFGGNINPDIGRHSTTAKAILHRMNIFEPKKNIQKHKVSMILWSDTCHSISFINVLISWPDFELYLGCTFWFNYSIFFWIYASIKMFQIYSFLSWLKKINY